MVGGGGNQPAKEQGSKKKRFWKPFPMTIESWSDEEESMTSLKPTATETQWSKERESELAIDKPSSLATHGKLSDLKMWEDADIMEALVELEYLRREESESKIEGLDDDNEEERDHSHKPEAEGNAKEQKDQNSDPVTTGVDVKTMKKKKAYMKKSIITGHLS